jgi:DNA-binding winged helix-turn-helix (wHTH) protein/tetratricopeptide (TPR) repeat protein
MSSDSRAVYNFDRFVLDQNRGALLGVDGSALPLRPKSFTMLGYMVENAGRLIDRDELMQAVWPDVFVTEDSITQCVKEIRRALSDETQQVLRTVPRRGYLLTVPATRVGAPEAAESLSMRATATGATMPAPETNRPVLFVLPLEMVGASSDQGYLADGITADLVADLTHFHDLCVISPATQSHSASAPNDSGFAIPDGAAYVFGGSLRCAGGRIRASVRLDDARSGISLWAERFDLPIDQLFVLQDELIERLPNYLVTQIELDAIRRGRRRPTSSLTAYDLCLQGREAHTRATEAENGRARELFARAIELDPDYAKAYAWQAYTVQRGFTHLWGEPRGRPAAVEALALAQRAVAIDPDSSFCLGRLAFVLLLNESWDDALQTAQAAIRANPSAAGARFFHGEVLTHAGDPEDALSEIRLALLLNPYHPPAWRASLGRALFVAGHLEEALTELHACARRLPNYGLCFHTLAAVGATTGDVEEARAAVRSLIRINPAITVESACGCLFFREHLMLERFRTGFRMGGMPEY